MHARNDPAVTPFAAGDTLIIWRIDRLGSNLRDLIDIVTTLQTRGVGVRSLSNGIVDTTTAHAAFVFGMFALMAEYEAALIRERTQAGLAVTPMTIYRNIRTSHAVTPLSAAPQRQFPQDRLLTGLRHLRQDLRHRDRDLPGQRRQRAHPGQPRARDQPCADGSSAPGVVFNVSPSGGTFQLAVDGVNTGTGPATGSVILNWRHAG